MQDLFSHTIESTKANTEIYQSQKARLSVNAWIILYCLLEGQHLSAINFVTGIRFGEMNKPKILCEYRRRLCEIRDAGIEMNFETNDTGCRIHFIHPEHLNEYRLKYCP